MFWLHFLCLMMYSWCPCSGWVSVIYNWRWRFTQCIWKASWFWYTAGHGKYNPTECYELLNSVSSLFFVYMYVCMRTGGFVFCSRVYRLSFYFFRSRSSFDIIRSRSQCYQNHDSDCGIIWSYDPSFSKWLWSLTTGPYSLVVPGFPCNC